MYVYRKVVIQIPSVEILSEVTRVEDLRYGITLETGNSYGLK